MKALTNFKFYTIGIIGIISVNTYSQIRFEQATPSYPYPEIIADFEGISYGSIAFADIDGDTDLDVMITGKNSSNAFITKLYINDGNGSYTEDMATPFDGVSDSSIAFADIDGDNDQDVLITGWSSSYVNISKLYKNDRNGNFTEVLGTPSLSNWDLSNVTDMERMFVGAQAFNQDIGNWDVSNVTNMDAMFQSAIVFNQDLSNWCVEQIPLEPNVFSLNSALQDSFKPNWGATCGNPNPDFTLAPNGVTCLCPNAAIGDTGTLNINGVDKTFTKRTRAQLDVLIAADQTDPEIALTCTSGITDMSFLFDSKASFNQDISSWDVSNVTNMSGLFNGASAFNQPLDDWDVANVNDMPFMFNGASNFNQTLNSWDVSSVFDMEFMFAFSVLFDQPLNDWDVTNLSGIQGMFMGASSFNQPLDNWEFLSLNIDFSSMFKDAISFNQPLNSWNVSNAVDMWAMFEGATSFNQPLNNWNISNEIWNLSNMFKNASSFDQPLDNWDLSNVTNMSYMFQGATSFNQDISSWNVSNVTTMEAMFQTATYFDQDISSWDVSNVTNMQSMFFSTPFNHPISNWNVTNVINMSYMFRNNNSFNQPLNNWNVSNVIKFNDMFAFASSFNQPLNNWDVSSATIMNSMFFNAASFNQDISGWCVENIGTEPSSFATSSALQNDFKPNWGEFGTTCSFIYENTSWSPNNPITGAITSTSSNLIKVKNGAAILNGELIAKDLIISSGVNLDLGSSAILNLNGDIKNDGTLTFSSYSSGSAQLDTFDGTISGNGDFTIERFIPAGDNNKRAFRFLTSAVNSTGSIYENWQENGSAPSSPDGLGTHITGGLASDGFDQSGSNNPSMFTFDNTNANGTVNQTDDWSALPNTNIKSLKAGEAYLTFVRGDRSIDLTTSTSTPTNTTLRATGALHTGSITYSVGNPVSYLNLSGEDEFYSLIGNPYQAVVDFNAATKSGLTDFIYVWDASVAGANGRGGYVTVDVTGNTTPPNPFSSDANQYLAPGMSFFVQNDNNSGTSASLTFDEDDKMTDETEITVFNTYPHFYINSRLYETLELQNGNTESDAIGLRFSDNFTTIADDEDATKLFNPGENYAIINNGLRSIDKQAIPAIGDQIDLTIINYEESNYSLTFVMENKPTGLGVFIVDNYLNTQTEVTESFVYDFAVDANIPESSASDRFSLVFDNTTLGVDENTFGEGFSLFPNPAKDGQFSIKTPNLSGQVKVEVISLLGQNVYTQNLSVIGNQVDVIAPDLSTGVYVVKLTQDGKSFSSKLIME